MLFLSHQNGVDKTLVRGVNDMKKNLFVLLATVVLLLLVSIPAFATPPQDASGDWTYLPRGDELLKVAGENVFLWNVEDSVWTGTFEGHSVDSGVVVLHREGNLFFKGTVSFDSVKVNGKEGSLEMLVNGTKPDLSLETDWKGQWVISKAGGDLAGLKGQGAWWGPGWQGEEGVWGDIYYDGKIHFE